MSTTLSNALASFTFDTDPSTGFKLTSFARAGGTTWTNADPDLWRLLAVDIVGATTPFTPSTFHPTAATFGGASLSTDADGQYLILVWTAVPLGSGDAVTVTLTLRLNTYEDWLRARISVAFVGTPTRYAIDSTCCMPLAIAPLNQGDDVAFIPFGRGITSENPIVNLRYDPTGGRPNTGFGQLTTNTFHYPAGRGWASGAWAYYETITREAWMVYLEDWSNEVLVVTFQSDGTRLTWEEYQPQEDAVLVGNPGRALGSAYTFCLRPFLGTQDAIWIDVGRHYADRLDANPPAWRVPPVPDRSDLSSLEKAYAPFVDLAALDTPTGTGDGRPGDLDALVDTVLANCGAPAGTRLQGVVEAPDYKMNLVGEAPFGDLQAKLLSLYNADKTLLLNWSPGASETFHPYSHELWDVTAGDSAEKRIWQAVDGNKMLRMSRRGRLEGGGNDRLCENHTDGSYGRERSYTVTNWNAGSRTATVSGGSPSADGFSGTTYAILVPANPTSRMARGTVLVLGASTVQVTTANIKDARGNVVAPLIGDTIIVFTDYSVLQDLCFHAQVNADLYFDRRKLNTVEGIVVDFGACGTYEDTYGNPVLLHQQTARLLCCRDHSAWAKLDAGYVRHPYYGGRWLVDSIRQFLAELRTAARDKQVALGKTPFFNLTVEDADETQLGLVAWDWHTVGSLELWRNCAGVDPAIHGYKCVPFFSVVHGGRVMGRGLDEELSSAILAPANPVFNDAEALAFQGFCLASEWPYGMTFPTLSLRKDPALGVTSFNDFWDDTQYVAGGGTVSNKAKSLRDLWVQIVKAESGFILKWLRYGSLRALATLDLDATDVTTGMAQSTFSAFYHSGDVIHDRAAFPRVVHALWRAQDGTCCVVFANWTDADGSWAGTFDTLGAGLGALGSRALRRTWARRLDADEEDAGSVEFDPETGRMALDVPAFSIAAVVLTPNGASMDANLVVGKNSYASLAEADAYLADSIRAATAWAALDDATKESALISMFRLLEKQKWAGEKAGLLNIDSGTIGVLGSGYSVDDEVELVGGDGVAAAFRITSVNGSGGVTGLALINTGEYATAPTSPAATTATIGSGTGLTLVLATIDQQSAWPRSGVKDRYGQEVSASAVPLEVRQAQMEGAFELSQDPSLETAATANSNISSVKAGSVAVDFFRPITTSGRFPIAIQELIGQFLASAGTTIPPTVTGTDACSEFATKRYGVSDT